MGIVSEFQSTTDGHGASTSLSYDTYYDLLINACVRYDKTKKANIGKRRNVYATNIDDTCVDLPTVTRFTSKPKFSGYEDITPQHPGILLEATGQLKTSHTT